MHDRDDPSFSEVGGFRLSRITKQWPHSSIPREQVVFSILSGHEYVYLPIDESTTAHLVLVASLSCEASYDRAIARYDILLRSVCMPVMKGRDIPMRFFRRKVVLLY